MFFDVFHGVKSHKEPNDYECVFLCVLFFFFPFQLRNYITHHKDHFMSLKALTRTGNTEAPHFPHHAQSVQRLAVLILIQEVALTFETQAKKDEGLLKVIFNVE